jgi:hypothetical protein
LPAAWRRRLTMHSPNVDFSYPNVGSKKSTSVACNPEHDPTAMRQSDEETFDVLKADDRDYYKVEKWTKDGMKVDCVLFAGNNLDKAREVFAAAAKHRPRNRLTIRQRSLVLERWPAPR